MTHTFPVKKLSAEESAVRSTLSRDAGNLKTAIDNGADVKSLRDADGMTLLHHAVLLDDRSSLRLLLAAGVDPLACDKAGDCALDLAFDTGAYQCVELLRAAIGPRKIEQDSLASYAKAASTHHPLHHAARENALASLLEVMMKSGERPRLPQLLEKDARGETVPDILMRRGCVHDLFMPQLWTNRLPELEILKAKLPKDALRPIDLAALTMQVRKLTLQRTRPQPPRRG